MIIYNILHHYRNDHIYFSVLFLKLYPDINVLVSSQWTDAGEDHHRDAKETTQSLKISKCIFFCVFFTSFSHFKNLNTHKHTNPQCGFLLKSGSV